MRQLMCSSIVILLLTGCESRVEIPIRHAGVVVMDSELIENQVLRPGEHFISLGSEVIIYEVSREQLDIEFDFLYEDVSEGNVKLTIDFTPVVDSLPGFYRKYESIYVVPVVDLKTRSIVRDLLKNYNSADFTKDELRITILDSLTTSSEITNYVKVHKVDITYLK